MLLGLHLVNQRELASYSQLVAFVQEKDIFARLFVKSLTHTKMGYRPISYDVMIRHDCSSASLMGVQGQI